MKKLLSLLMASAIVFTLAGCEEKEVTKKYEGTQDKMKMEDTLTAKGDEVTKETSILTMKYADMGFTTPEQKKIFKDEFTKQQFYKDMSSLKNVKGVKYEEKFTDEEIQIKIDVDYSKADMKELSKAQLFDNAKSGDKVSLEETEKNLKEQGLKEVK